MEPFPEESALRQLFGVDPALLDPNAAWRDNALSFESVSGADQLECLIEPVYGTLTIRWSRGGKELVYLDLTRVRGLSTDQYRGRDSLLAFFDERTGFKPLRIQVRPTVHVSWGTKDDLERLSSPGEQRRLPL